MTNSPGEALVSLPVTSVTYFVIGFSFASGVALCQYLGWLRHL